MTDKYAIRFTAISFYTLAIAIFVSVSLLSVYHLLTLIAFVLLFSRKEINFKNLPASAWALFAFIAAQLLSAAVNFAELEEKSRSIGSIKYPLIAILCLTLLRYQKLSDDEFFKKHSQIAFNVFLATIIITFAYGFTKVKVASDLLNGNDFRVGGFTDVMRYGYGSGLILLVLLATALNIQKFPKLNKAFLWLTFAIGFAGMYLSYTRGAMLGFLLGIPVVFFFFNKRLSVVIGLVSVAMISLMIIISFKGGSTYSRFFLSSKSGSNSERMSQYLSAIHAFKERPVFGFGPQQLKFHVKEIKEKYNLENKHYIEHAHNIYLEIAANTGIIGLLAFLTWLGLWCKDLFYQSNTLAKQIFLPVILFILVAGQFEMLLMAQTSSIIYFFYALSHHKFFKTEIAA
ncbi:MAG: O-antigen ligase family protein [Bdellovibrionota bacterium]